MVRTLHVPGRTREMYEEHCRIFEALKTRDPELAKKAMLLHLCRIKETMQCLGVDTSSAKGATPEIK